MQPLLGLNYVFLVRLNKIFGAIAYQCWWHIAYTERKNLVVKTSAYQTEDPGTILIDDILRHQGISDSWQVINVSMYWRGAFVTN